MGGNKVAPPGTAGGAKPTASGKTYVGKPSAGSTSNTGPSMFKKGSSMGVGGGAEVAELEEKISELKINNDTLDKEREFYFGKLRDIEEMLQKGGLDQDPLGEQILKILYASEEEKVEVDESGNLTIT